VGNPLRKELQMVKLKPRKGTWYARIQWRDKNGNAKDWQRSLGTKSKPNALLRLTQVRQYESDIKDGLAFTFPWQSNQSSTELKQLKLSDAVELWLKDRKSNGIRPSTIKRNRYSMKALKSVIGSGIALLNIKTKVIDEFRNRCIEDGRSADGINIDLRTIKTFLGWCYRRDYIGKVPHIDMVSKPKSMPLYVPDRIFADLMRLDWLNNRYKTAFLFYRETGCRVSEPFNGILDGNWLLISGNKTKQRADKELRLRDECLRLCVQMKQHLEVFNGTVESWTQNLSKTFLKAMREIDGDNTDYHLHCLRHTFAVRRYLQTRDIYLVKKEMGHASVTTTEIYADFSLRRLEMDFPTLVESPIMSEKPKIGTQFVGTPPLSTDGTPVAF